MSAAKNPWNITKAPETEPCSLADVMSEQLAVNLAEKDGQKELKIEGNSQNKSEAAVGGVWDGALPDDCTDDMLIAQMLQHQFDKEYEKSLKLEETQRNGGSKVSVSYSNFRVLSEYDDDVDSEEEQLEAYRNLDDSERHWDSYETSDKVNGEMPRRGYKKVGDSIITKHDKELSQRSNGKRIMEFPPGIETGDGGGMDMQLSNAVYNKIRNFSIKEGKRKNRVQDKSDKSTADQAFDDNTRLILFKLVDSGLLERINGIVSTGKEAVIVHADTGDIANYKDDQEMVDKYRERPSCLPPIQECAIKIFKTSLNEFKTREKYIKDDYRFKDRFSKQNPRKVIHMWAEKELHNLKKMSRNGLPVPEVLTLKKHVLVMSFIGKNGTPAPKLRDAAMNQSDLEDAYDQTVHIMKTLYEKAHLVHADFSEYNILWHEKKAYVIDVSQSVEPNHPHGLEFLLRDCINVSLFFKKKKGLQSARSPQQLFTHITGLPIDESLDEEEILIQVREYQRKEELRHDQSGAAFDELLHEASRRKNEEEAASSSARPIPGHSVKGNSRIRKNSLGKSPGGSYGKSPTQQAGKSPGSGSLGKSPKNVFFRMNDEELAAYKQTMLNFSQDGIEEEDEAAEGEFDQVD